MFKERAINTQWGKDSLFNKCYLENWIITYRMKLVPHLTILTNLNTKLMKNLHLRPETLKLLGGKKKKTRVKLLGIVLDNTFLVFDTKSTCNKAKINK